MPRWRALRRPIVTFLSLGLALEIVVAVGSTALVDLSDYRQEEAASVDETGVHWLVTVASGPAGTRYVSTRERGGPPWNPHRATGPPDTPTPGDHPTAWASDTPDGDDEWLELDFPAPVAAATEVRVYESYNPGATTRVGVFDDAGREHVIPESSQRAQSRSVIRVAQFRVPRDVGNVRRVKLYIDSRTVPGWNEIDAAALIDRNGAAHWATAARASSWYGSARHTTPGGADRAVPRWSDLRAPRPDFASGAAPQELRTIEARGWPLPALWGELNVPPANPAAATSVLTLRPIWLNLLIDAVILGALLWLLWLMLTRPARFLKESSRARRGACLRCGYDLQFDLKQGCPECGWRR
jgi:hypothetical protein